MVGTIQFGTVVTAREGDSGMQVNWKRDNEVPGKNESVSPFNNLASTMESVSPFNNLASTMQRFTAVEEVGGLQCRQALCISFSFLNLGLLLTCP